MGNIINFPENKRHTDEARNLKKISDSIDHLLLDALESGELSAHELAGLLAHRLGNLMKSLDSKASLWDLCEKVAKKQAVID